MTESFSGKCECEETFVFKEALNFKNDKLEAAKATVLDKATLAKQKELAANMMNEGKGGKMLGPDQKYFEVEISPGIFSGPSSIILTDTSKVPQDKKGAITPKGGPRSTMQQSQDSSSSNVLEIVCNPTKPANYSCLVILKSLDRTDIRLYEYKLYVTPQKIRAQLEFRVPARSKVSQDIPIVNNSTKTWEVSAVL